jgi:hypothetical protein
MFCLSLICTSINNLVDFHVLLLFLLCSHLPHLCSHHHNVSSHLVCYLTIVLISFGFGYVFNRSDLFSHFLDLCFSYSRQVFLISLICVLISFTCVCIPLLLCSSCSLHSHLFDQSHRLNMELDLQSLFGLLCTALLIG